MWRDVIVDVVDMCPLESHRLGRSILSVHSCTRCSSLPHAVSNATSEPSNQILLLPPGGMSEPNEKEKQHFYLSPLTLMLMVANFAKKNANFAKKKRNMTGTRTHGYHSLSQQGIWMSFAHRYPQQSHLRTPTFWDVISQNVNFKHTIEVFPPQYNSNDIMRNFDEWKHPLDTQFLKSGWIYRPWWVLFWEYSEKAYPMNTNMTGFRCFSKISVSLCFGR